YGLSVISTPQRESGESIGPMQYGITYIVRPCMQPSNSASIFAWASAGAIQWLFGPASSRSGVQTKVRCSTRATSSGSERCSQLPGWVSWLRRISVPSASMPATRAAFSASLPSHQWIASGRVSAATSATQALSAARELPAVPAGKTSGTAFTGWTSAGGFWGMPGAAGRGNSGGRDQRRHHVLDVVVEFFLLQPGLAQLQVQLQEADVGRVGEPGAVAGRGLRQAGLAERRGEVVQPALGHAADHRLHDRVVHRAQELGVHHVGPVLLGDHREQRAQALPGIADRLQFAERLLLVTLP